jgi:3-deoxy-7-phosphoheptulonate synthase
MILVLDDEITKAQIGELRETLIEKGFMVHEFSEAGLPRLGVIARDTLESDDLRSLPGVHQVVPVTSPFKLVSRQMHPENTVINVGEVEIGGDRITVIAGPRAIESRDQAFAVAKAVRRFGAVLYHGDAFKPHSSPYAFQGLEEEGLKVMADIREATGMPIVSEITSPAYADLMLKYVDVMQIGARNMQNFELLKCVGRMGKPVLLKRGLASTIKEWLMSAEYILAEGNAQVILCESGIRTFEPYTRNTLDLSAIPVLKSLTHLPVLIDPSHATGQRDKVSPMARSAIAAGADALMIEVHNDPDHALSNGPQSLYPQQFGQLMRDIYVIAPVVGKQIDYGYLDKAEAVSRITRANGTGRHTAAFCGREGNISHKACVQYFGSSALVKPMATSRALFESVASGHVNFGVIPLENSLSGSIHENYDLLLKFDLKIIGEVKLRITHNLITHSQTELGAIRRIFATPQTFRQCRLFMEQHEEWEQIPVRDSVGAIQRLRQNNDPREAIIGIRAAATQYGLKILHESIETNPRNYTRFVVIGLDQIERTPRRKSSLIFSTGNQPGALFDALQVFADNGINMVKLESRPISGKPWEYMFYADIEADVRDVCLHPILRALRQKTDFLKILGSY